MQESAHGFWVPLRTNIDFLRPGFCITYFHGPAVFGWSAGSQARSPPGCDCRAALLAPKAPGDRLLHPPSRAALDNLPGLKGGVNLSSNAITHTSDSEKPELAPVANVAGPGHNVSGNRNRFRPRHVERCRAGASAITRGVKSVALCPARGQHPDG